MQKARTSIIASVLNMVGWIVVFVSVLAGAVNAIEIADTVEGLAPGEWIAPVIGAVSGLLLIGLGTIIQRLHRTRLAKVKSESGTANGSGEHLR